MFLGNYIESYDTANSIILGENLTTNNINNSIILGTMYNTNMANVERSIVLGSTDTTFDGGDYEDSIILVTPTDEKPKTIFAADDLKPSFVNSQPSVGLFGVGTHLPLAKLHIKADGLRALIVEELPVAANDADAGAAGILKHEVYKTPTGELRIKL